MKKVFKTLVLVFMSIFFVILAYAYNQINEKFLSLKQSEKNGVV